MSKVPQVRIKASFNDGAEDIDRVLPVAEAEELMRGWASQRSCTHFEARGLWNQDRKAYDEK